MSTSAIFFEDDFGTTEVEGFKADAIQYLRPNGNKRFGKVALPLESREDYDDMVKSGCRLELEVLRTGEVSATVFDVEDEVDVDISLTKNGPEVKDGIVAMLSRRLWKQ